VEGPNAFKKYWSEHQLPFIGLSDPKKLVPNTYGQEVNLFKLGRMPALMLIDRKGQVRYQHYGESMRDIPENAFVLSLIDRINSEA
jgi:peroxiredoxin Q/BCP